MNQHELLRFTIDVLESLHVDYLIVGSFASAVYGEPRSTHDIDIVVELNPESVEAICDAFPSPEFYVSREAAREALASRRMFNVIHPRSGNKIDFMIVRDDAWGRSQMSRRIRKPIVADVEAYLAAPEDIILGKLWFYDEGGSEKHLRDIVAMLQVSGGDIDREYIEHWCAELELAEAWRAVLRRLA